MAPVTRRRFLEGAAGLAAAASLLPPNLRRALAQAPARPGSLRDIEHVVLLMQENRSFDHYFGTLAGVRGFGDALALVLADGRSVFHQPDPTNPRGYVLPFHLDTRTTSAQKIPSTNHSWKAQHAAWNHGRMDRWITARRDSDKEKAPFVMGYHTRADVPFHYALADAFTICDAYHCSVLGPTWPNRTYWMTGTIDAAGEYGGPMIANKKIPGGYRWTTYAERLQDAGVNWKVYQQQDNYGCNVLEYFQAFQMAAGDSDLYRRAMLREPAGTFEDDARNDRLPAVSWLIPTSTESEHPDYMPAAGAAFIASKLEAIAARPEVWAKTAFILSYDENDGLFDHVPPPVPPVAAPGEFVQGQPIGGGFRVPCIIVSPWTVGGWVCSERFDHTSVLRFLEKWTGVAEPNISAWRRRTFGDLTAAFRFADRTAPAPGIPDAAADLRRAQSEVTTLPAPSLPGDAQASPVQERGERPRVGPRR